MNILKSLHISLIIFIVGFFAVSISSCSKDDEDRTNETNVNVGADYNDQYMVRYIAYNAYNRGNIFYTDKDGKSTTTISPLSITIGPVSKGFKASVHAYGNALKNGTAIIEVSKNGGEYVVKASNVAPDCYASCTINF